MTVPTTLLTLTGTGVGLGLWLLTLASLPRARPRPGTPVRPRTPALTPARRRRWLLALAAAVLTLVATRWVVAALGVGALVLGWERLVATTGDHGRGTARPEALAGWTESLRDSIAGSVGLEQAVHAGAGTAGPALRRPLHRLVDRLRMREPLPGALLRLADDLDDPAADVVVAALVLNARLRGPGLRDVLTALAVSTREELDARRRVEAERRSIHRSVRIVLVVVLGVMALLTLTNRSYVAPYATLGGQLVLALVAGLLLLGLLWLRRLSAPETPARLLVPAVGTHPGRTS
ncbi:type II secretion system F family protein [Kineococcus gynurae]|uniref:Type II secretion system F family protein n=1 Tax=Kineococcus gynurae TaxID=452979 RepID=A0ABV5LXN6_9ACTN